MSELDKKKAILDELKTLRNYALTSLIALIAFIFTQFDKLDNWILFFSSFALIVLGIAILILQRKILKIIKEIGEL